MRVGEYFPCVAWPIYVPPIKGNVFKTKNTWAVYTRVVNGTIPDRNYSGPGPGPVLK